MSSASLRTGFDITRDPTIPKMDFGDSRASKTMVSVHYESLQEIVPDDVLLHNFCLLYNFHFVLYYSDNLAEVSLQIGM